MSCYDLIALDMDGTLLNTEQKIAPQTLASIREAFARGKQVVLCTGRPVSELAFYMDDLSASGVRYMICESGSLIWDNIKKKVLGRHTLAPETVQTIVSYIKDKDIVPDVMSEGQSFFQRDHVPALLTHQMGEFFDMFNRCSTKVPDIFDLIRDRQDRLEKFNLFHTSPLERDRTLSALGSLPAQIARSEISAIEFSPLHIDKGSGLRELASALNIPMEHIIAAGDADNDLPMITAAGLGLAMGNSNDRVKSMAGAILPDNDHNGCGWAIKNILLTD